jgi:MFS family permease
MNQNAENSCSRADPSEHTRWNFVIISMESSAFQTGMAWTDPSTVLPLFVRSLGGSTVLVGLVPVLQRLGWILPQLPMAAIVGHRPRRLPFLQWGVFVGRLPFLVFLAYLWLHGLGEQHFVLAFMLFAYFCVALGNGVVAIPWQDIIAKSIPSPIRGRFFGLMQFITGCAAFGVGFVVRWALGPRGPAYPYCYFLLFSLAALFMGFSTVGCWLAREPIRPVREHPHTFRELLHGLWSLVKSDRSLRLLALVALFAGGVVNCTAFYIVFATRELGVQPQLAGVYIWGSTFSTAIASLVWARFNDRCGPRTVLRGATAFATLAPALALLVPAFFSFSAGRSGVLPYAFALVFVAAGAAAPGMWIGNNNYLFELTGHEDRHRYIAAFNTLAIPGALLPWLVGWLLSFLSFRLAFAVLVALGVTAVSLSLRMPRPTASGSPIAGPGA